MGINHHVTLTAGACGKNELKKTDNEITCTVGAAFWQHP